MIEKLLAGMIPIALQKIKTISVEDKRSSAYFITTLCALYLAGNRADFEMWIERTNFPLEWKIAIIAAVWD